MTKKVLIALFTAFSILLFVLLFVHMVILRNNIFGVDWQSHQYVFSIAWAILGSIWASLGILSLLKQDAGGLLKTASVPRSPKVDPKTFINRLDDIRAILELMSTAKVVSLHGQKGVGKSEFLKYVSDILRRGPSIKALPKDIAKTYVPSLPKVSFYVDLADSTGWNDCILHISYIMLGNKIADTVELASKINEKYKKKALALIFDNVNNFAFAKDLLRNVEIYKSFRPDDIVIIGSISRLYDPRLQIWPIEIFPFKEIHCKLFLSKKGLNVTEDELSYVVSQSSGLPLFLNLIALNRDVISRPDNSFSEYYIDEVFSKLDNDSKELLLLLAVCNIGTTTISISDLHLLPIPAITHRLRRLKQYSTVIEVNYGRFTEIKLHDLIRDIVLDFSRSDIPSVSTDAVNLLKLRNKLAATIIQMLASNFNNMSRIETITTIEGQIAASNFPFLIALWESSTLWANSGAVFHADQNIKHLCIHGYISALLGTGSYYKAEELASSSVISQLKSNFERMPSTTAGFDLQYLLVDLDHLLNRYELARSSVEMLLRSTKTHNCSAREGRALWLDAHLIGHIGDNLHGALSTYSACIHNANMCGDALLALRARTGQLGIKMAIGALDTTSEVEIKKLIEQGESLEGSRPVCSALYRNLSRYLRLKGDYIGALAAIDEATLIASEGRLRTTINCDYSKGEIYRFQGKYDSAIEYYRRVIEATIENGDMNLNTSAILASCICDLLAEKTLYASSFDEIEEHIAYVDKIAKQKRMLVTGLRAGIVRRAWSITVGLAVTDNKHKLIALATELALIRDVEILEKEIKQVKYLEIHVH